MKQWFCIAVTAATIALTGCASSRPANSLATPPQSAIASPAPLAPNEIRARDADGPLIIQKVELRPGVSSSTVERLAKEHGCTGNAAAGLVTEKGPVEVYRMACDNGTSFLAQCELRQCRPMRPSQR